MFQCPRCSNTLADHIVTCQFCGNDVSKVVRPPTQGKVLKAYPGPAKWIWPAYYAVSGYWFLSGAFGVVRALGLLTNRGDVDYLVLVISAVIALLGLGMIARIEFIRGFINVVCWLQIAAGILGGITSLALIAIFGAIGILFVAQNILDIVTAGLMIYLVGETD